MDSETKFIATISEILPEATLESSIESLLINSLNYIRMLVLLEETYNFQFEDEALSKAFFSSLKDIHDYIIDRLSM